MYRKQLRLLIHRGSPMSQNFLISPKLTTRKVPRQQLIILGAIFVTVSHEKYFKRDQQGKAADGRLKEHRRLLRHFVPFVFHLGSWMWLRPYIRLAIRPVLALHLRLLGRVSPGPFWLWCFGASRLPPLSPGATHHWKSRGVIESDHEIARASTSCTRLCRCVCPTINSTYAYIICFPVATTFLCGN